MYLQKLFHPIVSLGPLVGCAVLLGPLASHSTWTLRQRCKIISEWAFFFIQFMEEGILETKTDCSAKDLLRCVLRHNFWTHYDLDLFSTSKWPFDLQFWERYCGSCPKMTWNRLKMIGNTSDSLLCLFHSIQFSPLVFLPL